MDRRKRDYFIVFFNISKGRWYHQWHISDFEETFRIENQKERFGCHAVKVFWRSINGKPYALLSIRKDYTFPVIQIIECEILGVSQCVEYTPEKETQYNTTSNTIQRFKNQISKAQSELNFYRNAVKRLENEAHSRLIN